MSRFYPLPWRMSPLILRICLCVLEQCGQRHLKVTRPFANPRDRGCLCLWTGSPARSSHLNVVLESSSHMAKPRRAQIQYDKAVVFL
ncbi:hypothetical protein BDV35DRAFT_346765, partial [Aspergillus flavus]